MLHLTTTHAWFSLGRAPGGLFNHGGVGGGGPFVCTRIPLRADGSIRPAGGLIRVIRLWRMPRCAHGMGPT